MKKAKIMLMSIAVLATVGSALAFKVAKKGITTYCYLKTTVAPGTQQGACPNKIDLATAAGTVTQYYYTTLTVANCSLQANCTLRANQFND